jgi:hypothetical protein
MIMMSLWTAILSIGAEMSGQNGGLAKPPFCPWKHYLMDKTAV